MKNANNGFTLLEAMITIAIVGIIAAFAVINNSNLLERNRAENYLLELKRNLMFARAKASAADEIVVVCPGTAAAIQSSSSFACQNDWTTNPVAVFVDYNSNYTFDGGTDVMLRVMDVPQGQDKLKIGATRFRFDSSGRLADGQATTVIYCPDQDNANNRQLTISQGGTALYNGETTTSCS
ncbi:putative Type IV pilus biogenesis protein [Pseudoalteromonas luteoviolacea B = ATCC 29581]|nr:putative Type IV pilus biogenesis protein [Pseudoalteromonas luteoviolacea B = ATCC 29581]